MSKSKYLFWGVIIAAVISVAVFIVNGPTVRTDGVEMEKCIDKSDLACLELLYTKDRNLNQEMNKDWTPLTFAANQGKLDVVKWMVNNGADVNLPAPSGSTAIFWASFSNSNEIVRFLIKNGGDPCWVEKSDDFNPREIADKKGNVDIVRELPVCQKHIPMSGEIR